MINYNTNSLQINDALRRFDYEYIIDELKKYDTNYATDYEKQVSFRSEIKEIRDEEELATEPYETARKLSLLVDASNMLAHSYDTGSDNKNRACMDNKARLMALKNTIMVHLAVYCLENDILAGYSRTIDEKGEYVPTLEVDIPQIGHVNWHLGSYKSLNKVFDDINTELKTNGIQKRITKYPYATLPKVIKDPKGFEYYTNQTLLQGKIKTSQLPYISEADRSLIYDEVISPKLIKNNERNGHDCG